MESKDKKGLGIIVGVGAAVAGAAMLLRAKAEPPEGEGAAVQIQIFDSEGNPVPVNSPAILQEGASYTARVTVTNRTLRGTEPWPADLTISTVIYIGNTYFYDGVTTGVTTSSFLAGGTQRFDYPFTVPALSGGQTGLVDTRVISPLAKILGTAQEQLTVETVDIIYGADVVIGV